MFLDSEKSEYRYERKFNVQLPRALIERIIHTNRACFRPVFAPRWINNIYLDTPGFESWHQNLEGASCDRAKFRIRWYGEFNQVADSPTLEIKIKHGHVNRKAAFPLSPIPIDRALGRETINQAILQADIPSAIRSDLLKMNIVLANRYYRSYFLSADGNYRITIDSELSYARLHLLENSFNFHRATQDCVIVELKYAPEFERSVERVSQQFPFRLSRNSKYMQGIETVLLN